MIWSLVDMLASEYHWSRADILERTSLDEVLRLQEKIEHRKLSEYKMLTMIYHSDPEEMLKQFDAALSDPSQNKTLDKSGFENLKNIMAMGHKFVVK